MQCNRNGFTEHNNWCWGAFVYGVCFIAEDKGDLRHFLAWSPWQSAHQQADYSILNYNLILVPLKGIQFTHFKKATWYKPNYAKSSQCSNAILPTMLHSLMLYCPIGRAGNTFKTRILLPCLPLNKTLKKKTNNITIWGKKNICAGCFFWLRSDILYSDFMRSSQFCSALFHYCKWSGTQHWNDNTPVIQRARQQVMVLHLRSTLCVYQGAYCEDFSPLLYIRNMQTSQVSTGFQISVVNIFC